MRRGAQQAGHPWCSAGTRAGPERFLLHPATDMEATMAIDSRPETDFEVTPDGTAIPAHDAGLPLPRDIAEKVAAEPDPMEADELQSNKPASPSQPGEYDERQIPLDRQRGGHGPDAEKREPKP